MSFGHARVNLLLNRIPQNIINEICRYKNTLAYFTVYILSRVQCILLLLSLYGLSYITFAAALMVGFYRGSYMSAPLVATITIRTNAPTTA